MSGAIRQGKSDNRFPHVKMGEILENGLMVIHENRENRECIMGSNLKSVA